MLWENEMLQQKAVMLGIYLLLYQHQFLPTALPFVLFLLALGSFSLSPFTLIAPFCVFPFFHISLYTFPLL